MNKLIIGNQKMYMDKNQVEIFRDGLKDTDTNYVIVCPSYPYLEYYKDIVKVGAQNISTNDNGAYTGEVSASQLKSLNVPYCIVGHSERREYQKELDTEINEKIKKLIDNGITPILCVGEKLEEKKNNSTETVIKNELDKDLKDLSTEVVEKIIIAYEPIWAIGTGLTPTNEEISQVIDFIKKYLKTKTLVLYGGSVSSKNVDSLNTIESVDGYLIGGSSSKIDDFKYIINSTKNLN